MSQHKESRFVGEYEIVSHKEITPEKKKLHAERMKKYNIPSVDEV